MGKGDKKSRRGKIILGTFGVRRRRSKAGKPEAKISEKIAEDIKPVKEKKVIKEEKVEKPVETVQEKTAVKEPKVAKVKKEVVEEKAVKEPKTKKEKKS